MKENYSSYSASSSHSYAGSQPERKLKGEFLPLFRENGWTVVDMGGGNSVKKDGYIFFDGVIPAYDLDAESCLELAELKRQAFLDKKNVFESLLPKGSSLFSCANGNWHIRYKDKLVAVSVCFTPSTLVELYEQIGKPLSPKVRNSFWEKL